MIMHINHTFSSPNFDKRFLPISMLIIHYTQMPFEAACARLCDKRAKLSAHYLIKADGGIFSLVDEAHRAWHAGKAYWRGIEDVNSASIGIELDHEGHKADMSMRAYPHVQMDSLITLSRDIIARHKIKPVNIIGHSDVAPRRKIDPGERFDWQALAQAGIGLWPREKDINSTAYPHLEKNMRGAAVKRLQQSLHSYGYGIRVDGIFGDETQAIMRAFQRHFRPQKIDGIADAHCQNLLAACLKHHFVK